MNIKFKYFLFVITVSFISSCKTREQNYITYYNKVNEIDSIYRIANEPIIAIKKYKKLFRKYEPKNQERIDEYENYIYLSDKYNKNFGGKKSLYKFINLIAPYKNSYRKHLTLFQKFGIDSTEVKSKISIWKESRNKILIDSITILFVRDQEEKRSDVDLILKNDLKNAKLMQWIFNNYGYPSTDKIGLFGKNEVFLPISSFFSHMAFSNFYPYFETKMKEYVKSGECPPRDYSTMVDRYHLQVKNDDILYGTYIGHSVIKDSATIDRNRKSIGLPTLKHNKIITKDFFKKLKQDK